MLLWHWRVHASHLRSNPTFLTFPNFFFTLVTAKAALLFSLVDLSLSAEAREENKSETRSFRRFEGRAEVLRGEKAFSLAAEDTAVDYHL